MANEAQSKTVQINSTSTAHNSRSGATYAVEIDTFNIPILYSDATEQEFAAFEFDFSGAEWSYLDIDSVESIELSFYFQQASTVSPIDTVSIVHVSSGSALSSYAAIDLWNAIDSGTSLGEKILTGNAKRTTSVDLSTTVFSNAIAANQKIILGVKKKEDTIGECQVGGQTMVTGSDTTWRQYDNTTEIAEAPYLVLSIKSAQESHLLHLMKYTCAADPSINQNTPSASIGGYLALNEVNTRAQIGENFSRSQLTMSISTLSSLPSATSGLVHVGTEIMTYAGKNSSTFQLTGLVRGVSPPFAYPASTSPFAEYVHYLNVDGLFDTEPSDSLVQYRCVAIQQQGVSSSAIATNIKIYLVQHPDSIVRADIGIEVPAFDKHEGSTLAEVTGPTLNEFLTNTADVIGFGDGYFNGGHLIMDYDEAQSIGPLHHIIDSYEYDAGTGNAAIILEDNLPDPTPAGTNFRIMPAPSQRIINDITSPSLSSGRFFGFLADDASNELGHSGMRENAGNMRNYDHFYLWIKRQFVKNVKKYDDTGAIIIIEYTIT